MRVEYLSALRPLLRGERADYHGEVITAVGQVDVRGATPPPVLVSALGPAMLRIAGELADGTITVWAGPRPIATYAVPASRGPATCFPRCAQPSDEDHDGGPSAPGADTNVRDFGRGNLR